MLNNVDDGTLVTPYIPQSGNGSILITARNIASTSTIDQKTIIVKPMDVEGGLDILLSHLARDAGHDAPTPEDKGIAQELCAELGGLPLAIT